MKFSNKLKISFTVLAIALITVPTTWAAFPVKQKTAQAQQATAQNANATIATNAKTAATTATVAKKETTKAKESYWKKLRAGGKSQLIALILVILVGGLGIHRFYLGYTWQGVVQLLTLGGCGIWALIDLIRIVTGDLEPKNGPYEETL